MYKERNKKDDIKDDKLGDIKRKHIAKRNVIKTYLSVEQNINFHFRLTSFGI